MRLCCSLSGTFRANRMHLPPFGLVRLAFLGALVLFPSVRIGIPQQDSPFAADQSGDRRDPFRHHDHTMNYQRIERLNALRQHEMTDQATRILQLATELNTLRAESSHFSPADLQKADTIAKLAHSVRQQMEYPITP